MASKSGTNQPDPRDHTELIKQIVVKNLSRPVQEHFEDENQSNAAAENLTYGGDPIVTGKIELDETGAMTQHLPDSPGPDQA